MENSVTQLPLHGPGPRIPQPGATESPLLVLEARQSWGRQTQPSVLRSHLPPVRYRLLLPFTHFPFHRAAVNSIPSFGKAYPGPNDPGISVSLFPFCAGMLREISEKNVPTWEKLNLREFRIFFFQITVLRRQFSSEQGLCSQITDHDRQLDLGFCYFRVFPGLNEGTMKKGEWLGSVGNGEAGE